MPASALPKASRSESPDEPMSWGAASACPIDKPRDLRFAELQTLKRIFGLCARELHAAMPMLNIFHERHAFALDRVRDDHRRLGLRPSRLFEADQDLLDRVTVDLDHAPAEGAEFVAQRREAHDVRVRVVGLQLVVV